MCLTQVKYQAATVKRKHKGQQKIMKDEQDLNKNTGKGMLAKTSKKCGQTTCTGQKKNKCMKKYKTYQYIVEATLLLFIRVTIRIKYGLKFLGYLCKKLQKQAIK